MKSNLASNAESFTPDEDLIETLEDGRTIQAAVKGVPLPRAEAVRLGLVQPTAEEKETLPEEEPNLKKAPTPAANKSATPSKTK
jgi:enoyl-CoA hydratase/carnithine racemase